MKFLTNKYFIYCNGRGFVKTFLEKNGIQFKHLNCSIKYQEGVKPLLFNEEKYHFFIFTNASLFLEVKDKLMNEYPFSKFLAEISTKKNIHMSRKILSEFNPSLLSEIRQYTTILPAENYGVSNKFSLDNFFTKDFFAFKNLSDLENLLSDVKA